MSLPSADLPVQSDGDRLVEVHREFNDVWQDYLQRLQKDNPSTQPFDLNKLVSLMFFLGFGAASGAKNEKRPLSTLLDEIETLMDCTWLSVQDRVTKIAYEVFGG